MRDPSIHVTASTLERVLKEQGIKFKNFDGLVKQLRKYSCDNRSVVVSNDKLKREATKRLTSTKSDTLLLADIIYSMRIKMKHRGVRKINEADREWLQLKELTKLANQFCEEFKLKKRDGYIKYLEMAFPKVSSLRAYISKFINMYESICNEFDSMKSLYDDEAPKKTLEVHDYFVNKIADKTGILEIMTTKPEKMLQFLKARNLADELGIDYDVLIDAQFDALDWCNGIPTPEQLSNDKARERLNKYLYENNIRANKSETKTTKGFWDNLKKRD